MEGKVAEVVRGEVRDGEIVEDGSVSGEEMVEKVEGLQMAVHARERGLVWEVELDERMAAQRSGGGGGGLWRQRRQRWLEDCSVAMTAGKNL